MGRNWKPCMISCTVGEITSKKKKPLKLCQNLAIANCPNDLYQPHQYLHMLNLILSLKCFHPTWRRHRLSYSSSNLCPVYFTLVNSALLRDVFAEILMNVSADEQNTWTNCAYRARLLQSAGADSPSQRPSTTW